jgi:hypothetical protein
MNIIIKAILMRNYKKKNEDHKDLFFQIKIVDRVREKREENINNGYFVINNFL